MAKTELKRYLKGVEFTHKDILKIKENIHFMKRIQLALRGELPGESICALMYQLEELIIAGQETVKLKEANGSLSPMLTNNYDVELIMSHGKV